MGPATVFLLNAIVLYLTYLVQGISLVMILASAVLHDAGEIVMYTVAFLVMGLLRRDVRRDQDEL